MGISQLLPLLANNTRPCHVSEFRGQVVAVDSYCWLHKGARSCALELAKGEPTDAFVNFCMKYIKMLKSYDIKPIMVFDGRPLPAKAGTEDKRREAKKQARKQGMEFLRLGQAGEAYKYFCQCIDVTPDMALALIKECRKVNVDCIVAPYEADAQLAYFSIKDRVACVISEDSDLLAFGCKKVLYKMDVTGHGRLVESEKMHLSIKVRIENYSYEKFLHMCILAGCDYLESLPGIGLKKALKFIFMTAENDPLIFLDRLPRYLNIKRLVITDEYKKNFLIAYATFLHQTVFDPHTKTLVSLHPIEENMRQYCVNAGEFLDEAVAYDLALGNLNPLTLERIDNWYPTGFLPDDSIWSSKSKQRPGTPPLYNTRPRLAFKSKPLDSSVIKKVIAQHDQQTDKELEFYKTPTNNTEVVEKNPNSSPPTESHTSPVLNSNPFLKKISKFRVTNPSCDQKVISRFFSSNVVGSLSDSSSIGSLSSFTSMSSLSSICTPVLEDESDDFADGVEELSVTDSGQGNEESAPASQESIDNKTESTSDDVDEFNLPQVNCECVLEVVEGEVQLSPQSPTLASVENLPKQGTSRKRKKTNQGEQKKPGKQMNIRDMFKRMRMN